MLNVILDKITKFLQTIQMSVVNKTVLMFVKIWENNENLMHAFTERNVLLSLYLRYSVGHGKTSLTTSPPLGNSICALLKQSMKLKRFCNFLVRDGQSSKPLWLKAKVLIQKVSVTLGSTLLSRPLRLLIS